MNERHAVSAAIRLLEWAAIRAYGYDHADSYAGVYVHHPNGRLRGPVTLRALFTRNLQKHARALRRVMPNSHNLQLMRASRPRRSLKMLQRRIDQAQARSRSLAHRLGVTEVGFLDDKNVIELGLHRYRARNARALHHRYGSRICVHRHDVPPSIPF